MPEIPSVFNRVDFIGTLLPGYLTVTLFLLLFTPDLLFVPSPGVSFDFLSALVFIAAGPAVGLAILQFHRGLYYIRERMTRKDSDPFPSQYAHVRLACADAERLELEKAEAEYDFTMSTGIGLLLLAVYAFASQSPVGLAIPILLALLGVYFVAAGRVERDFSYTPLVDRLLKEYPLP